MSGAPRRRRGADTGPRPVGESLDAVVAKLGTTRRAGVVAAVFTRWVEIAGPELSRHVEPVRLDDEVLVVAADHPAWATQARSFSTELLGRVAEVAGERPQRLEVTVGRRRSLRDEGPVG